jgi:uncharacterized protein YndB with AHSA1/START domain
MNPEKITVTAAVAAEKQKVWEYYTAPEHITQWNFADPSWHCPSASNDMRVGGRYIARMEARDGSFGFDFKLFTLKSLREKLLLTNLAEENPRLLFRNKTEKQKCA